MFIYSYAIEWYIVFNFTDYHTIYFNSFIVP